MRKLCTREKELNYLVKIRLQISEASRNDLQKNPKVTNTITHKFMKELPIDNWFITLYPYRINS